MATDQQQPAQSAAAAEEAEQSAVPLTNGTHADSQADASDRKPPDVAPKAIIADITSTTDSSRHDGDAAAAAEAAADGDAAAEPESLAAAEQHLTDISLSQDLDIGSGPAAATEAAHSPAPEINGSATGCARNTMCMASWRMRISCES